MGKKKKKKFTKIDWFPVGVTYLFDLNSAP